MRNLKIDEGKEGGNSIVIVAALAVCARRAQKEGEKGRSCPISMGVTANVAITRIKRIYMPAAAEATRAAIQPLTAPPLTWIIPYSLQATWTGRPLGNFQYGSNINWAESEAHSNITPFFAVCHFLLFVFHSHFTFTFPLKRNFDLLSMSYWPWLSIFYDCRAVQLQQLSTLCESRWRDRVSATWPRRSYQFRRKRDGFKDRETVRQCASAACVLAAVWNPFMPAYHKKTMRIFLQHRENVVCVLLQEFYALARVARRS